MAEAIQVNVLPQKDPHVSVLMLSFNYAQYLNEAIDSVLRQTYPNFELIVVDDGSQDSSLSNLRGYQSRDPSRIKVFTHPNNGHRGLVASLNLALSKARGSVITFLEADDLWHRENLGEKIAAFQKYPEVGVVYSDYKPFGDFGGRIYWNLYAWINNRIWVPKRRPFRCFEAFLYRNPVASFTHFAVRRKLLNDIPPLESMHRNNDWWVLGHLSAKAFFYFIPEKLTFWRIHRGSAYFSKVNAKLLWKLHRFLVRMYRSLYSQGGDLPGNFQTMPEELGMLHHAFRMHDHIEKERTWFSLKQVFRYPLFCLRLIGHIGLKNLLLRAG